MTSTNDLDTIEALQRDLEKLRKEVEDLRRENEGLRTGNAELMTRLAGHRRGLKEEYDRGHSDALLGSTPRYITEGSFGKISALPMKPIVYKTTILGDRANGEKLKHEFEIYNALFKTIQRDEDSAGFISPKALQLCDPFKRTVTSSCNANVPPSSSWDVFEHPTMALEQIPSIPPLVGLAYRSELFSANLNRSAPAVNIRLLRLYLGRELPNHIEELQEGLRSDLALDVGRYNRLSDALEDIAVLPPLSNVARGMGTVLSQLHWGVGVDGMDAELVMGGDGLHGLRCWVLDFNQCARWLVPTPLANLGTKSLTSGAYASGDLKEGAIRLARRIANCEQYYPKPSQDLYVDFKSGYEQTTLQLVDAHRPNQPSREWELASRAVIEASRAFLTEFEDIDLQKRMARTGKERPEEGGGS